MIKAQILKKWDEILRHMRTEYDISALSFDAWILHLSIYDVSDGIVHLAVDNRLGPHGIEYIEKRYAMFIKASISEIMGQSFDVDFSLLDDVTKIAKIAASEIKNGHNDYRSKLDSRYTFDNFVVGPNNKLAHSVAVAVSEAPGEQFNPLFIYGGVGLGKTHLMQSIAHQILDDRPDAKVLYVTSESFTNEVIESIRSEKGKDGSSMREKFRTNDVLLIDDIQFIGGKESTEQEFFNTFQELYGAKKHIIISSDKPPKDLLTLEQRLVSRFEMGMTVDIQPPDYETRVAILRKKMQQGNMRHINDEIIDYIALNIKSNIRSLEGSLTKVNSFFQLQRINPDLNLAMSALKDYIVPDKDTAVSVDIIVNIVASYFDISAADIYSSNRSHNILYPRQICMYVTRVLTDLDLKKIGKSIGNKDHSTVYHSIKKITDEIADSRSDTKRVVDEIVKKIST